MTQDILNQVLAWVALFVGIASLVLACYTIWLARITEREIRESFQRADERMREHYERMKDVLAEIKTQSATTEQTVKLSQEHLLTTITNLVNETLIPKRQDPAEVMGMQFMQMLAQNPGKADEMMRALQGLADMGEKQKRVQK